MTKTDLLCRMLQVSGLLAAKGGMLRGGTSPVLRILAYHRVVDATPADFPFDRNVISCTPAEFEREMGFVTRHFDVVTFRDIGENGVAAYRRPLIVTFDDGYRDNHDIALPILQAAGIPAVFFVTTDYIDGKRMPWWDEVTRLLHGRKAAGSELQEICGRLPWPSCDDPAQRVIEKCKRIPDGERKAILAGLRAAFGDGAVPDGQSLMMTWDDVRALAAKGMEIGSHTMTHPVLDNVGDLDKVEREVAESKMRIERETGKPVVAFSYPVGRPSSSSDTVVQRIRAAGYRFACLYEHGVNVKRHFDSFRLLRIKTETGSDFGRFKAKVLFPGLVRY